ncbi:MAG: restriction endonuclease subunit S, partial [Pseudomonadota bacterium]|nr:restriction endonuclease subunit S [Pseudomonadota bacterium]
MSSKPSFLPISQLALINPQLTKIVSPYDEISFIPMADVSESGRLIGAQTRRQVDISSGYTPFEEGDVLFAKITPCMENGKGYHAVGLINGVGYGSTEFHVLRAIKGVNSRFLYYWTTMDALRKKAETFMIGSAGQQRVQASFFDYFVIPVLKEEDQRFAAHVLDILDEAIRMLASVRLSPFFIGCRCPPWLVEVVAEAHLSIDGSCVSGRSYL